MAGRVRKVMERASKISTETWAQFVDELNQQMEEGRATMNSIDYGILVVDEMGKYLHSNKLALTLFQIKDLQKERPIWFSIEHVDLKEFLEVSIQIQTLDSSSEFWIHGRLVSCQIKPWVFHGKIKGSLIWIEDITERRAQLVKIRHIEAMARLGTMAQTLAHEIKNPLGAISIHLQLLKKSMTQVHWSESMESTYQIISEEITRLGEVVHAYLNAARPLEIHLERADIAQILTESLLLMEVEAEELGITIAQAERTSAVPMLSLDRGLIKQCFVNLLKNAMQSGAKHIYTRINILLDRVEVILEDDGDGISNENIAKIFEPHFTTKKNGNGLGLTIVFKILREHGAFIDVESPIFQYGSSGHGTRFSLTFNRVDGERIQLLAPHIDG
ncbi:sensor histidine kinase [Entomospira culicis]|uniref:histidine kinase n=1 Tax=Entomospira culicis TaxID=2719989 RepID=A0A968GHQ5_9SPIO|nr:ATP-binding protein [Entomospira culicis]NIZ19027.1 hypothetical protein [Entomospira culicis]NIZ69242.1 hypothetical protein [Entomospira culicis]WDI37826.1 ATP-binding protein [Entomospira culicis]WDI39454.1 ATP-binding protein [Entomospira culicis]